MTNFGVRWTKVMAQFNIAEAKTHLSELTRRAIAGEDIVIARDNQALVRLVPVERGAGRRVPGSGRGEIVWVAPDFDDLPDGFEDYEAYPARYPRVPLVG